MTSTLVKLKSDKYGRKVSWKVKRYGKYGGKVNWIVKRYGKYGKKGKLNSEMIWKIWKIPVLIIITHKESSSSSLPPRPPAAAAAATAAIALKFHPKHVTNKNKQK